MSSKSLFHNYKLPSETFNNLDTYKIIKDWSPALNNFINTSGVDISNLKELKKIICLYLYWAENVYKIHKNIISPTSFNNTPKLEDDINNLFKFLYKKIKNVKRLKIVGEYYNPISGNREYKLENGKFIEIGKSLDNIDLIFEYLPKDFCEHINMLEKIRKEKIKILLDN